MKLEAKTRLDAAREEVKRVSKVVKSLEALQTPGGFKLVERGFGGKTQRQFTAVGMKLTDIEALITPVLTKQGFRVGDGGWGKTVFEGSGQSADLGVSLWPDSGRLYLNVYYVD